MSVSPPYIDLRVALAKSGSGTSRYDAPDAPLVYCPLSSALGSEDWGPLFEMSVLCVVNPRCAAKPDYDLTRPSCAAMPAPSPR